MVRIGKWDEAKVLFKDGGHTHVGGTSGARLGSGAINATLMLATGVVSGRAMGTGAVRWGTAAALRRIFGATVSKHCVAATSCTVQMNGGTGFANVEAAICGKGGTVDIPATSGPASIVLGASLDATIGDSVHLFVWGT